MKTNHLNKRYQAFISSTYLDLHEERESVRKELSRSNYIVEGMELFPPTSKKQWEIIKDRIDKSDIYILIVANRYGSVADALSLEPGLVKEGEVISYTNLEFRYAHSLDIPIIAVILNSISDKKVTRFVKEIQSSGITTARWSNATDLVGSIFSGLSDITGNKDFIENRGWIKAGMLNKPIKFGDASIFLESKIQYVKFISFSWKYKNGKKQRPLYKRFVLRTNKTFDVWDEYVALTINQLSHLVDSFQYYIRTDGDAVDFTSILPFVNKLFFADANAGSHDKQINPLISLPSNVYVQASSFFNGFQDGNTELGVKATDDATLLTLIVDFTSIPDFRNIFKLTKCIQHQSDKTIEDITDRVTLIQDGVYFIQQKEVKKNSTIFFYFELLQN